MACRAGQPPSPGLGLGLASPGQASVPSATPGWVVRAGGASPAPPGAWRSDQGNFGLEAGGTARAGADAGQHGHLRTARGAVAAS